MNEFLPRRERRKVRDIPLAPVLDLLTVVVFFLVLSTSFTEFTKQTLPPTATAVIDDPSATAPLNPQITVTQSNTEPYHLLLSWSGNPGGKLERLVNYNRDELAEATALQNAAQEIAQKFKADHADEKTVQLRLGPNLTYQTLVSVMDGVRVAMSEVVLVKLEP